MYNDDDAIGRLPDEILTGTRAEVTAYVWDQVWDKDVPPTVVLQDDKTISESVEVFLYERFKMSEIDPPEYIWNGDRYTTADIVVMAVKDYLNHVADSIK